MTTTDKWSGAEDMLRNWSNICKYRIKTHQADSIFYSRADSWLTNTWIAVNAASGATIVGTAKNHLAVYISGGIVLLNTILAGVAKALSLAQSAVRHANAADKYSAVVMNIQALLAIPASDRAITPEDALNATKNAILQIESQSPVIPNSFDEVKALDARAPPPDFANIYNRCSAPLYSHRPAFWPESSASSVAIPETKQALIEMQERKTKRETELASE